MAGVCPDLFRILISTDNHLGYLCGNETRGNDSFLAFEEVLQTAKREEVDFLLLGGDLFHEHSPSKDTMHTALTLLSQYTLGEGHVKFATAQTESVQNYLNEHLSISLPIFIIHGNHDDPSVQSNVSALDVVATSHFINYFGKPLFQGEQLYIKPIKLQKGRTTLLLYGIGHMKDERLHRLFRQGFVHFEEPEPGTFSILVLHQNRFKGHGPSAPATNCVFEKMIPEFFDLVVWGHEHDCHTQVTEHEGRAVHIYQPGSSIATSLIEGEAIPKHMGLLEVKCGAYRLSPIPYKCVRPMIYRQIDIREAEYATVAEAERFLTSKIEAELRALPPPPRPEFSLPLVRFKVTVGNLDIINAIRINTAFSDRVANTDIVIVHKKSEKDALEPMETTDIGEPEQSGTQDVIQLLQEQLKEYQTEFKLSSLDYLLEQLVNVVENRDPRALETAFQNDQNREISTPAAQRKRNTLDAFLKPNKTDPRPAVGQKRLRDGTSDQSSPRQPRIRH